MSKKSRKKPRSRCSTKHPLYGVWVSMRHRCHSRSKYNDDYANYGARGIAVCERWRDDFWAFVADMPPRPPWFSIDRIDNDKGYEPGNCRWVTPVEQNRNKRNNVYLTAFGRTQILSDWHRETGINLTIISRRIKCGWSPEDAISVPVVRAWRRA